MEKENKEELETTNESVKKEEIVNTEKTVAEENNQEEVVEEIQPETEVKNETKEEILENDVSNEAKQEESETIKENVEETKEENSNRIEEVINPKKTKTVSKKPFFKNKTFIILASILTPIIILAIIITCIILFNKTPFDMQQYVLIETHGYNTYATAELEPYSKYASEVGKNHKNSKKLYINFLNSIKPEIDIKEDLKNGDVITIKVSYDADIAKQLKIDPKNTEFTYEVKDLQETTKISLFNDIVIEFSGYSPFIRANIINNSNNAFLSTVTYYLDKTQNLKEGDEIVVTAEYNIDRARQAGYSLDEQNTKTYKVENVGKYITTKDQLTQELKTELDQQLTKKYDSVFNAPLSEGLSYYYSNTVSYLYSKLFYYGYMSDDENIQFNSNHVKTYLLTPLVPETATNSFNKIYKVYKVKFTPSSTEYGEKSEEGYVIIEANTVAIEKDGKLTYQVEDFNYKIYNKLDDIVNNAKNNKYNVEEI